MTSIRCAFMSSRPSSNTANSAHGPAPMMSTSVLMVSVIALRLPFGRPHHQAVELALDRAGGALVIDVGDLDHRERGADSTRRRGSRAAPYIASIRAEPAPI